MSVVAMSDVPNNNGSGNDSAGEVAAAASSVNGPRDKSNSPPETAPEVASKTASETALDEATEREVNEALASMDPADLAELCGGTNAEDSTAIIDSESVSKGDRLTGTVACVADDDIFLEFGAKAQGVLPKNQFAEDQQPVVGDRLEVIADRIDRDSGLISVRREGTVERAEWDTLAVGALVEGRATGMIKGGLELSINGLRAFMPGSQVSITPMKDISELLNEVLRCEVIEVSARNKNLLVSRRKVLERERREKSDVLWAELEVGQVRDGVVGTIKEFGAFVDLGGLDGLVHIRDLSYGTVENVADVLTAGQQVKVQVLKIEKKRNRISLGLKQALPDPWIGVGDRFQAGTSLKARIVRLADFGAFAEIETGVEALIPISEMSWTRIRQAGDVVSVGDMVDCVVMRVEEKQRRAALSIRQAIADPWEGVAEAFPEKSLVKGKVTRLADFGAFVELIAGVEGLIHISELSDTRVRSCSDVVSVGQEVEARVLGVDRDERRISLSIKAVHEHSKARASEDSMSLPKPKQRKKPLRGGLSSHFEW